MKSIEEIYQEIRSAFADCAGVEPAEAGDFALRLYAVAAQIHSLWLQAEWTRRQCFPQTADGECLDCHAQVRGLERRAASAAVGTLRFYVDAPVTYALTVPAGTVGMTAGLVRFETIQTVSLPAGRVSVDVPARALEPGQAGNIAPGAVVTMSVAPVGIARCTNPSAFAGGVDVEDDESLRLRVLDSYKRLPNGANAAFYEQGALSFDTVAAATVLPRNRGIGTVDVVVSTYAGIPDSALLEQLREYFETRREIAVDVGVLPPVKKTVNVAAAITPADGYDFASVSAAVQETLRNYFDGKLLSQGVLRAKLGSLIYSTPGVQNYVLTAPAADVAAVKGELPMLGTLAVSAQ